MAATTATLSTTLNLSLSSALQTTLGKEGIWAHAVYFDADGKNPVWTNMVTDGSVKDSGSYEIGLPQPYSGGKVYFLIQSEEHHAEHHHNGHVGDPDRKDLVKLITTESDINWGNADKWDVRYDSIEVTLKNSPFDVGNLTSVNGFGLPMELSVTYSDGTTSTRGYEDSGDDMFTAFKAISDHDVDKYDSGPLKGKDRMAYSPAGAIAESEGADPPAHLPFQASDWDAYIGTLKVADPGVAITGFFNGAPDANNVWHNGGFYSYTLEWDATAYDNAGGFWLNPADNSQIKGHILIKPEELANSIYSTLGDVAVYTDKTDDDPYRILDDTTFETGEFSMNSGANNQWGNVLAQFLTGFTAGFYGTTGKSFNPLSSDTANLNHNWNWDPDYAFGANLDGTLPAGHYQDPYSEAFYSVSNSYGSGYTDNLMKLYAEGGPLISVSEPSGTPDAGKNVSEINLTIFDDSETPTGYEPTVIHHYLAPGGATYEVPNATNGGNFKLSFTNVGMVLADDTPIAFDIFGGLDGGGAPIWHQVTLDPGDGSLWQNWTLVHSGGGGANPWSISPAPDTPQGAGNLLITGFPTSGSDGIYWNRIHVGDKIFNLYSELTDGGQKFNNPNYTGQGGDIAIDGLAVIQPPVIDPTPESVITFTATFLSSSGLAVNPDLVEFDPSSIIAKNRETPDAPVAGTVSGGAFTALAGQTDQVTNSIQTSQGEVAFGWTGLNPASGEGKTPWIHGYTNKVGAQNYAEVTVTQTGSHQAKIAPVSVRADIDGQWQTDAVPLGNGTYTVTMQEHLVGQSGPSATTVNNESSTLNVKVKIAELNIDLTDDAQGLEIMAARGRDAPGNWIDVSVINSSAAAGTVLVFYATNAAGELVSRDGMETGAGVSIGDATLGTVGSLVDGDGDAILFGSQTLYLHKDLQLNVGVLEGNGEVQTGLEMTSLFPQVFFDVPDTIREWLDASRDGPPAANGGQTGFFSGPAALQAKEGGFQFTQAADQPAATLKPEKVTGKFRLDGNHDGDLTVDVGDFVLKFETNNDLTSDAVLGHGQQATSEAMFYLEHGTTLEIELAGSSENTNELGFVRFDIDPMTGERSVDGVAYGDTDAFRNAVADNLDDAFDFTGGGEFRDSMTWTVAGQNGFYAPVLLAGTGDIFVIGDANSGGAEHIRIFGDNTFGFEELTQAVDSDFDYNDLVMTIALPSGNLTEDWLV